MSTDHTSRRLTLARSRDFSSRQAGRDRREAITAYAEDLLEQTWVEATGGADEPSMALAAVGSLSRGDAGPLSDFDLVLVHTGRSRPQVVNALAERLWYPLWDNGIRLDHSVRTIKECRSVAAADLTAAVGLLDLRHMAGDPEVVASARAALAHDWRANARTRLPQLVEAIRARHARSGDLAHAIEPDLKEAHGGLRDLTILAALSQAWLAERPRGRVDEARDLLLDVRDALQVVTGRARDRLGQPDQDAVAALLEMASADDLLTEVSAAGRDIAYALDGALRRAGQSQRARTLRVGPRRPSMKPLGFGLFESDGEVVLGSAARAREDELLPLRAAVVAARSQLPISPVTLANLAAAPRLPEPWPELARELFAELLASGPGLVGVWEGLDQSGIIETWLPEWSAVRSRPQRNAVHRHTVDRHLIETVVRASGMVREVARADLLLMSALLHDIGKVPGAHDHSVVGAPIAAQIARRLGFDAADVTEIERAVAEHLTLIQLATRRDVTDPATIAQAKAAVGESHDGLDLLLALTRADAQAAGPTAWSSWRASLLDQLGDAVRTALSGTIAATPEESGMPVVADEFAELLAAARTGDPVVQVGLGAGIHVVEVFALDRPGLFADVAGLLAAQRFSVRTATLRTIDGVAVDRWVVEARDEHVPQADALTHGLRLLQRGDRTPLHPLDRRAAPAPLTTGGQARAYVVPQASTDATVLEVRAPDRPGLLHHLGLTLAAAGLSVRSAHIATHGGQALDTFYVTRDGAPLTPALVASAIAALIDS